MTQSNFGATVEEQGLRLEVAQEASYVHVSRRASKSRRPPVNLAIRAIVASAVLGAPLMVFAEELPDTHQLVIRTAPHVELRIDAAGGPWFLPAVMVPDAAMLGDAHRIHEALWNENTLSMRPIFPGG